MRQRFLDRGEVIFADSDTNLRREKAEKKKKKKYSEFVARRELTWHLLAIPHLLVNAVACSHNPILVEQSPSAAVSTREAEERRPSHRYLHSQKKNQRNTQM